MSVSSALSSAKRRRAGTQEQVNSVISNTSEVIDNGSRMMSVQDVLYMFHNKIEDMHTKLESSNALENGNLTTQITDSIDNMNETLENFATSRDRR